MKKNYTSTIIAILCIGVFTKSYSQDANFKTDAQLAGVQSEVSSLGQMYQPKPEDASRMLPPQGYAFPACDSDSTLFSGGNSYNGNMFNVVALNNISVTSFDVNCAASGSFSVYYKTGSFVGFESSSAGWTLLSTSNVVSTGSFHPSHLNLSNSLALLTGDTVAFYIFSSVSVTYSNGPSPTCLDSVYSSNADLKILIGYGNAVNWGLFFTPRIWNGTIYYCATIAGVNELPENKNIKVYPNPVSNYATLSIPQSLGSNNVTIKVSDVFGKIVMEFSEIAFGSVQLDCRKFATGMYYYAVYSDGFLKAKGKFIKQ